MDLMRQSNLLVEENCSLLEGGDPPSPITEDGEVLGGELDSEYSFSIVVYQGWAGDAGVTRRIVDFSFCTFARHWDIKQNGGNA